MEETENAGEKTPDKQTPEHNGHCFIFSHGRKFQSFGGLVEGTFESRLSSNIRGSYYVDLERFQKR